MGLEDTSSFFVPSTAFVSGVVLEPNSGLVGIPSDLLFVELLTPPIFPNNGFVGIPPVVFVACVPKDDPNADFVDAVAAPPKLKDIKPPPEPNVEVPDGEPKENPEDVGVGVIEGEPNENPVDAGAGAGAGVGIAFVFSLVSSIPLTSDKISLTTSPSPPTPFQILTPPPPT